jgi:hypothetical protein
LSAIQPPRSQVRDSNNRDEAGNRFQFPSIDLLVKETAIANQLIVSAKNGRQLRRQTSLVPGEKFLQHALRLLVRVWPREKRMKSRFAISSARGPMSSFWNDRRLN